MDGLDLHPTVELERVAKRSMHLHVVKVEACRVYGAVEEELLIRKNLGKKTMNIKRNDGFQGYIASL